MRHQLLPIKIRETIIPQQPQLGEIFITVLFRSTLGLYSQACQSVCRLGNYRFHDTKLVERFLSDGPHTSSMYWSTYPPTHPVLQQYVVWYNSKAQYTAEKPIQQPTNLPCVYDSTTTVVVQQYSRKKKKQKSGDRGIWTNVLRVGRTPPPPSRDRVGFLNRRSACPEYRALPLSQKEM